MSAPRELRSGLVATPFAGLAALDGLADPWEALRHQAGLDALCNGFDWVRAYARSWVPDRDLFGWLLRDRDGQLQGLLALRNEPSRGPFALPRLRLLQDGSFESDYIDLPARPGAERAVVDALLELGRGRRGPQAMVLGPLPVESRVLQALREALGQAGLPVREEAVPCPAMALPESFDAYLASLRKRMRSKVRQALRKAEERGAEYRWCHEPDELGGHLEGLYTLHTQRWNAIGGSGAFAEPRRRAFYAEYVPRALAAGTLRFARLELEGRPVAYQIGFELEGRYYQLQEGYAPELEELRVGTALRAWMIERLIEAGATAYDFMAGASRHKTDWGATDRPCVTVAAPLPKWRGRLAYGARELRDRIRSRQS